MALEFGDNQNPKSTQATDRENDRGHGGRQRSYRGGDERRRGADESFVSLVELLKPKASGKAMQPRAENALRWLKHALEQDVNIIPGYEIRLGAVSRERGYTVKYPGIVITIGKEGSNRVCAHTLMLEDGEALQPLRRTNFRGEDISPVPVPADVWDDSYKAAVQGEVFEMYKDVADIKYASMGVTVVPHDFAIPLMGEKVDNNPLDSMFVHIVESLSSFYRWLTRDTSFVKLGEAFNPSYEQLIANVDQSPTIEFDQLGQPRRADFCISLSIKKRRDSNNNRDERLSYNTDDAEDSGTILRVSGYVLPYYTNPDFDKKKPRNFGINIVVTAIEGKSTPSPELFLYGLASTSVLTNLDMWVDGFKPSIVQHEPNRNLGGLFLELPDEKDECMPRRTYGVTSQDEFLNDVDWLFSSDFTVSLDCSESGPTQWVADFFANNEAEAIEEAANNLTDNEFGAYNDGLRDAIVESDTRRFYTGEYTAEHNVRDIRDVDYLYLINAFDENRSLDTAREWDYSLADPTEFGLYQRHALLQEALGHANFRVTGYIDRVVIDSDFYEDLIKALNKIDMLPNNDTLTRGFRPKQRLEASSVKGAMSTSDVGSNFRTASSRGISRRKTTFFRERN